MQILLYDSHDSTTNRSNRVAMLDPTRLFMGNADATYELGMMVIVALHLSKSMMNSSPLFRKTPIESSSFPAMPTK